MRSAIVPLLVASSIGAQTTTITPTPVQTIVDLFLGAKRHGNYSFAADVVGVDSTATTYEITCNSGALNLPGFPTTTCDSKDPVSDYVICCEILPGFCSLTNHVFNQPWTVTDGPSTMIGILSTAIANVTAVLDETCAVDGRTAAYCNYTFVGDSGGRTTSTSYATTITGDNYAEYAVMVTAGVEKLSAVTVATTWNATTTGTGLSLTSGTGLHGPRMGAFGAVVLAAIAFVI